MSTFLLFIVFIIAGPLAFAFYLISMVLLYDWALRKHSQFYCLCPACHRMVTPTEFACHCGAVQDLTPTKREIFYQQCVMCGRRLPTLPWLGRNELIALCPNPIHTARYYIGQHAGKYPDMAIPLVGNTSTGKTEFLAAWVVYVQTQLERNYPVEVSYPFQGGPEFAKECQRRFANGASAARTSDRSPVGIGMDIVSTNGKGGLRAFFYDPPGEVFDFNPNSLQQFHYYDFMNGCLFLIDPFATPGLWGHYNTASFGIAASEKSIRDGCEKFINGLREHGLARSEYHFAYCAVVITKTDAKFTNRAGSVIFSLDSQIGDEAVRKVMSNDPSLVYEDVLDEICEEKLRRWGMGGALDILEENFVEVRYFSVSAYGKNKTPVESKRNFTPERVEMPILWMLNKRNPKLIKLHY